MGGVEKLTDVSEDVARDITSSTSDQEWETFFGVTQASQYALIANKHMNTYNIKLEDSSKILFCTDGLHDVLTNDEIEAILKKDDLPEVLCKVLISSVIEKEGDDDVSVVVIINQK